MKKNFESVSMLDKCIVLNKKANENVSERNSVLVCTSPIFIKSNRTNLEYSYAIDITDTSLGREYKEAVGLYRDYIKNINKAREVYKATRDYRETMQMLFPAMNHIVNITHNENDSVYVRCHADDCETVLFAAILTKFGEIDITKDPMEVLSELASSKEATQYRVKLLSDISESFGDYANAFNSFLRSLDNGVVKPKKTSENTDVRDSEGQLIFDIEDNYSVAVKYSQVPGKQIYKADNFVFITNASVSSPITEQ